MSLTDAEDDSDQASTELAEAVPVDNRLCLALASASRAMNALYRPLLVRLDLTYPQFLVMSVLWEDGSHVVGTLAERLALDPSTVSPLLKRLEARQLVVRNRDPRDERRVMVRPTAKGAAMQRVAECIPGQVSAATHLSEAQEKTLVRQLKKLTTHLARRV